MVECIATRENPNPICYKLGELNQEDGQRVFFYDQHGSQGSPVLDESLVDSLGGIASDDDERVSYVTTANDCYANATSNALSAVIKDDPSLVVDSLRLATFCGARAKIPHYEAEIDYWHDIHTAYNSYLLGATESAMCQAQSDVTVIEGGRVVQQETSYDKLLTEVLKRDSQVALQRHEGIISLLLLTAALHNSMKKEVAFGSDNPFQASLAAALSDVSAMGAQNLFNPANEILSFTKGWVRVAISEGLLQEADLAAVEETRDKVALAKIEHETMPDLSRLPKLITSL